MLRETSLRKNGKISAHFPSISESEWMIYIDNFWQIIIRVKHYANARRLIKSFQIFAEKAKCVWHLRGVTLLQQPQQQ